MATTSATNRLVLDQPVQAPSRLVCTRCWDLCFSTKDFRGLCQTSRELFEIEGKYRVSYTVDKKHTSESALNGCGWCSLINLLDDESEYTIPTEFRGDKSTITVELGIGWLHETYTPDGNNRFRVWVNGVCSHLSACTTEDSAVSKVVTARPLHTDVTSDLTFKKIQQWIQKCSTHLECGPLSDSPLPTRLIEVAPDDGTGEPRITSTKGVRGKYVALSYCWGGKQLGMTVKENFASRFRQLDTKALSKTVLQAIQTTKRLGLRYVWVDAICIIQDDEEDRTNEIRQMCDIYRQAYLTVVAANASRSSDGFWDMRPSQSSATKIPFWSVTGELSWVWVEQEGWYGDDSEPINTRCWTLQERLLSHRLVIFASHTIQLQCQHDIVNLGDSLNIPTGLGPWRLPSGLTYPLRQVEAKGLTTEALIEIWKNVITLYSKREIKRVEERLVALSGLAQAFNEVLETPYLAGLWFGPTLPSMLLWQACSTDPLTPRFQTYIAPSWSWASYPNSISYRNGHKLRTMKSFDVEILSSTFQLQNPLLPFGKVSAGRIVLKAHVKLATFIPPAGLSLELGTGSQTSRPPIPPSGIYPSDFMLPDCVTDARFDYQTPHEETGVVCLALASRSYEYDGVNYTSLDGLLVERTAQTYFPPEYRRIGSFFGAMREEFAGSEKQEIALV
jgi:hypothetical protein